MSNRRRFLQVTGAVSLAAIGATPGCGSSAGQSSARGPIAAGKVKDVPPNSLAPVADQPVALGRDAGGLYALTTICTHEQCNMRSDGAISTSGLTCSCHNSTFDRNGAVTGGPARGPLEHYRVDVASDGSITIQAGDIVTAATRTAV
ncbi:MAG: hypothetical protein NVS3B20_23680 [Polyangiales bacterium]